MNLACFYSHVEILTAQPEQAYCLCPDDTNSRCHKERCKALHTSRDQLLSREASTCRYWPLWKNITRELPVIKYPAGRQEAFLGQGKQKWVVRGRIAGQTRPGRETAESYGPSQAKSVMGFLSSASIQMQAQI